MANSYLLFSEKIEDLTDDEKEWIHDIPDGQPSAGDDGIQGNWEANFMQTLREYGIDASDISETLDMFPAFEYDVQSDGWWLYSEESAYLDHVTCVVQALIKRFRPEYIFKLTWAEYCDKLRLQAFGGGWVVVSANKIVHGNVYQAADAVVEAMQKGEPV